MRDALKRVHDAERAIALYIAMRDDARKAVERETKGTLGRELGAGDSRHRGLRRPLIALSKAIPNVLKSVREYNANGAADEYGLDPLPAQGAERLLAQVTATMAMLDLGESKRGGGTRGRPPRASEEAELENEMWDACIESGMRKSHAAKRVLAAFGSTKGPDALRKRQKARDRARTK
jgi:hypothetical protein